MDLAAEDVQFSVSWVLSLLCLKCSLLFFELLDLGPEAFGSHDCFFTVFYEGRDLLKFRDQLLVFQDELLLNSQRREVWVAR